MSQPTYDVVTFKHIIELVSDSDLPGNESGLREYFDFTVEIRADGIYTDPTTWTPQLELVGAKPAVDPSLPIQFTAHQLAAYMLDGAGGFIQEFFGEWDSGPDEDRLALLPVRATEAKAVLRGAYCAMREAIAAVDTLDPSIEAKAAQLGYSARRQAAQVLKEMGIIDGLPVREPLERARIASLNARDDVRQPRQEADEKFADWRRNIVRHLLAEVTAPVIPVPAPVPASEPATPEHDESVAAVALSPEQERRRRRDKLPSDEVEKRAELLRMFRELDGKRPDEAGKKGRRGALADLERESGIDSKNLGPMLDKAIEARRAADMWKALKKDS